LDRSVTTNADGVQAQLIDLGRISPIVSYSIKKDIEKLRRKYLLKLNQQEPTLNCENFILQFMRKVFHVANDCVDLTQAIEQSNLHTDILYQDITSLVQ